ncbi:MAG: LysR family transcriptional regulator [Ruminococcus sp.]|nr:LysR family transcriptional regulator [Ruminococcus sp.]
MLNLNDLSQFVAFNKYGTLTKVAEELFISQPTITRTMKRVEQEFGVPLFNRTANRIELNETGKKAAKLCESLISLADDCLVQIRDFDRKLHTITVESCAPAPLWSFIPKLTEAYHDKAISSKLNDNLEAIEDNLNKHLCDVAILPYSLENETLVCKKYLDEHLSICVPKDHVLAKYTELTTDMINGYNCLLASDIGFWNSFCKRKLPASKFLVQTDEFAFTELIRESTLPCFTTNLVRNHDAIDIAKRITIPITDEEANVSYYLIYRKDYESALP